MLIEIPDDLARKVRAEIKGEAAHHRQSAATWEWDGKYPNAVSALVWAAILEADLSEPIQVGHLARNVANDATFLVLHVGRERAFVETTEGLETSLPIASLIYAGPKPEGWGQ